MQYISPINPLTHPHPPKKTNQKTKKTPKNEKKKKPKKAANDFVFEHKILTLFIYKWLNFIKTLSALMSYMVLPQSVILRIKLN